jgi:hypothetical protein
VRQNYFVDLAQMRLGRIDDGTLRFTGPTPGAARTS